jgi:hypothetical protein
MVIVRSKRFKFCPIYNYRLLQDTMQVARNSLDSGYFVFGWQIPAICRTPAISLPSHSAQPCADSSHLMPFFLQPAAVYRYSIRQRNSSRQLNFSALRGFINLAPSAKDVPQHRASMQVSQYGNPRHGMICSSFCEAINYKVSRKRKVKSYPEHLRVVY